MPLTPDFLAALQTGVAPGAWPGLQAFGPVAVPPLPDGLAPIRPVSSGHPARQAVLQRCCDILTGAGAVLNGLDAKSGGGNTGSTLASAARALKGAVDRLPLADMTQLYRAISAELAQTMGGSPDVLLAICFSAAGDTSAAGRDRAAALSAGLERVCQVGGAALGDRTMVDALAPALAALGSGLAAAAKAPARMPGQR